MQVLLTQENDLSYEIIRHLQNRKLNFDMAFDSNEALEKIRNRIPRGVHYDLIFLFDFLSDMNGAKTLERVRAIEEENKIKLRDSSVTVMLTRHSQENHFIYHLYKGCDYLLQLPIDRKKLATIIETTENDIELRYSKSA